MSNTLQHIGIIMDGNGRWAKKRFLPRVAGHIQGVNALKKVITHCDNINIKYLTVFAFGRENWQRPQDEVGFLMKLVYKKLNSELTELHQKNARIKFIGDRTRLSTQLIDTINSAEELTKNNTGLVFSMCFDYSGQHDIIQAVNQIIKNKKYTQIDEEILARHLYTNDIPNPELVIRTSGEHRLSNFLLWQSAYSELYFTDTYWPDFSPQDLDTAISWYKNRERRFGKISEQLTKE
jgi:undecaprenyl diphosphate synthase